MDKGETILTFYKRLQIHDTTQKKLLVYKTAQGHITQILTQQS